MLKNVAKRSDKVAFLGIPSAEGEGYVFHRMKGFTSLSTSKNPREYSRQYVDESFEQTDVVGYNTAISFSFDLVKGNLVHKDIVDIFDGEKMGGEAVRPIVIVDIASEEKTAIYRDFAIIAESEGDGTDGYVYSGTLKTKGDPIMGTATSADDWMTCTFVSDAAGE